MKEIKLTQGKVALVDDEDYEYLNQWKWYVQKRKFKRGANWYALRYSSQAGKLIYMHRIINNTPPDMIVDHIDKNGLNNQKNNLRNCTVSQNNCNKMSFGRSKYLGVDIVKGKKKYRAQLNSDNRNIYLGSFSSEEEAARAYDEAAKLYHGEFANLNFK